MKRARRNNRVTANLYDILSFPSAGDSVSPAVPFRDNIKAFLSRHARVTFPPSLFPSLLTWQILFRVGDLVLDGPDISSVVLALDIVEEDVTRSSRSVYCNQCRVVGWGGHPVCKKRYHFIIRANNSSPADGYQRSCNRCGNRWSHISSESRCKGCDTVITTDDIEDWVYSQFEDNTHLLHGVVHSNGFGHLLLVNGREGGSSVLTGSDIMNFWDRLCETLAKFSPTFVAPDASTSFGAPLTCGVWQHTRCAGIDNCDEIQICAPHSPLGSFAAVPQDGIKFHLMMRWFCSGCRGICQSRAMKLHSEEMQEYPNAQTAKRIAKSVSSLRSLGQSPNPQE